MLNFFHRVASHPVVYDAVQSLAGVNEIHRRLALQLEGRDPCAAVADLGGGTGTLRKLFPNRATYTCLDIEMPKLRGFRRKYPEGNAVLGDVTRAPIKSASMDVVTCINMAHHLFDNQLRVLLEESERMLKASGTLILVDPIWAPSRWTGRMLWALDRGSNPRTAEALGSVVSRRFRLTFAERFAVYHEYALFIAVK